MGRLPAPSTLRQGRVLRVLAAGAVSLLMLFGIALSPWVDRGQARGQASCEVIGFSPNFALDLTAVCVATEVVGDYRTPTGNLLVTISTDGGKSWEPVSAAGLQGLGPAIPSQVLVSVDFADNKTVYVHVHGGTVPGLYRSTDGGNSFANVDLLARTGFWSRSLEPFVLPAEVSPPVGGGRDGFAYANEFDGPALVAPPLHQPVVASPDGAERFLLPKNFPATAGLALARRVHETGPDPNTWQHQFLAYRCDASLTCAEQVHSFPPNWVLVDGRYLDDGSAYVVLSNADNVNELQVWRSSDGATFEPWDEVNALMPPFEGNPTNPSVSIAASQDDLSRYYMRISYNPQGRSPDVPPADRIFRSENAGARWKRVAFRRNWSQPGKPGKIPWQARVGPRHARGDLYVLAGDRLMVIASGSDGDAVGAFCSLDRGKNWNFSCP